MTIDSRNLVGAGLALAIAGLAAWGSVALFGSPDRAGVVEVRPLIFSVDDVQQVATDQSAKK